MTDVRLQRYAVYLSGHSYDIVYKSTHKYGNADALSRLPLDCSETEGTTESDEVDMFYCTQLKSLPVTSEHMGNYPTHKFVTSYPLEDSLTRSIKA